jgi:Mlc titration factor MtfA (ptsG expression regulator)
LLRRVGINERLWRRTIEALPVMAGLSGEERRRLKDLVVLFLHEKEITPAGELNLDEAMRLRIAALACLLILNLGFDYYRGWYTVVVYPGGFMVRHQYMDETETVLHEVEDPLIGEAWEHGPVVLSWEDIVGCDELDGVNVIIHEFAHKLDMLMAGSNGLPPLHADMSVEDWSRIFTQAFEDFQLRVEQRAASAIDAYAAESPAEFFAVLSEVFFEIPHHLKAEYPEVYRQLAAFYRQDPGRRFPPPLSFAQ